MICRICGDELDEKEQDNVSPVAGYPVCEDCKDEICCEECSDAFDLFYDANADKILCRDCLIEESEKRSRIHSGTIYFNDDWHQIGTDGDLNEVVEYLKDQYDIQELQL